MRANKLTVAGAVALMKEHGATTADLATHDGLKKFRRVFATANHPDVGGDYETFKAVNSAVNLLLSAPERGSPQGLLDAIKRARDLGFFRIQIRGYEPYPSWFWKEQGYFGRVESSRTFRRTGKNRKTDQEVADAILQYIGHTASKVGQVVDDPASLIVKITLQPPIGRNTGHFAVAWTTQQDSMAQRFGHRTRWYSISMDMTPADSKKWLRGQQMDTGGAAAAAEKAAKKEKWNRASVERHLFASDLRRISGDLRERWAPRGTPVRGIKDKKHLILSRLTIKPSLSWGGSGQIYFGELTLKKLDAMIREAGGTPPGGQANQPFFVQPGDVPVKKARAVQEILATNGSGTPELWAMMDVWVAADGLRSVLETIGRIYEANGSEWSTGEQNWWVSQLR